MINENELVGCFDAKVWAEKFVETVKEKPGIAQDEGTMLAWFANAIMAGYDEANRRHSVEALQKLVVEWADSVFPDRTPEQAFRKLMEEEIEEMKRSPKDEGEFADAVIVLLDLAHLTGIDVNHAVKKKMEINKARKWKLKDGLFKHIRGEGE